MCRRQSGGISPKVEIVICGLLSMSGVLTGDFSSFGLLCLVIFCKKSNNAWVIFKCLRQIILIHNFLKDPLTKDKGKQSQDQMIAGKKYLQHVMTHIQLNTIEQAIHTRGNSNGQ